MNTLKINSLLTIFIFLAFIYSPTFLFIFSIGTPTGEQEKRNLSSMPSLPYNKESFSSYPKQFEEWLNDHIPYKHFFVNTYKSEMIYWFSPNKMGKVIIGKNGWLFYDPDGKDGDPIKNYIGNKLSSTEKNKISQNAQIVGEYAMKNGITLLLVVAPNKETVLNENLPESLKILGPGASNKTTDFLNAITHPSIVKIDLREKFKNVKNKSQTFFKTDTHWNNYGAWIATETILSELKKIDPLIPIPQVEKIEKTNAPLGDLINMLGSTNNFSDENFIVTDNFPHLESKCQNNTSELQSEQINCFSQNALSQKKVLILRDSFCHLLCPQIARFFSNSRWIVRVDLHLTDIDNYKPDIIILEIVERFANHFDIYGFSDDQSMSF